MAKRTGPASGSRKRRGKPPWGPFFHCMQVVLGLFQPLVEWRPWRAALKVLFRRPLTPNEALQLAQHAACRAGVIITLSLLIPNGNADETYQGVLPELKERIEAARAAGRN